MMNFDSSQRISAFSGMALIVLTRLGSDEVIRTAILAAIGGVTSYLVTLLIKFLLIRLRQKLK